MSSHDHEAHFSKQDLTLNDILKNIKDEYVVYKDQNRWPPSKMMKDQRMAPGTYLAMTFDDPVIALLEASGFKSQVKQDIKCFNCGQMGHMKRGCPLLKKSSQKYGRKWTNNKKNGEKGKKGTGTPNNNQSWKKKDPTQGASETKTMKGTTYKWCSVCGR